MFNKLTSNLFHPGYVLPSPEALPTVGIRSQSKFGPTVLWNGEGDVVADIIFVHGLRGDKIRTWSKGDTCWPRDMLKTDIKNMRIITWGYDSSVVNAFSGSSQSSISSHAEVLLADISSRNLRRGKLKSRPIIFVGHSLGGIVIKQALIRAAVYHHSNEDPDLARIYTSTRGIVFLGTPHRGSDKANLATIVSNIAKFGLKQPNSKLVDVLHKSSQVLEEQKRSFASISNNMRLVCVCEEMPMSVGGIIVPESSATIDRFGVKVISVPANHVDMCKFAHSAEIGYIRILNQIIGFVENEVERPEHLSPFPLPVIESHRATVSESNTKDSYEAMYSIQFQLDDGSAQTFSVVDKGFVHPSVNKWSKLSDTTFLLGMDINGSSGSLLFKGNTTGEIFSVAAGIHNYRPWCDILTDLEAGAKATHINRWYYRVLSGRLLDNLSECKKTSSKGTSVSLIISQIEAWDGTYSAEITVSDSLISGPVLPGAVDVVQVTQGQVEPLQPSYEVTVPEWPITSTDTPQRASTPVHLLDAGIESSSLSEDIQINKFLASRHLTTVWDIQQDPCTAKHLTGDIIPEALLSMPATEPPVYRMRIISDEFPWDINIVLPRNLVLTVGQVFAAIHGTMVALMEEEDWDDETPNGKYRLHQSRCARLARGATSFKVDSNIKRVDILGDKTWFMGLLPLGPTDEPEEWLLKLAPLPPPQEPC